MAPTSGTAGQRKGTVAANWARRAAADTALRPVQRTAGNRQRESVAVQPPAESTAAAAAGETDVGMYCWRTPLPVRTVKLRMMPCASICY